jgi:CheY-like chemotaxis protein/DNA-directed RNA polymerase specialized sigma24 family protein
MPSLYDVLFQELPYLRWQAFAFTGSRQAGDEVVAVCLSAISATPEQLDRLQPRRDIYRVFCRVARQEAGWRDELSAEDDEESRLWRGLGDLPPVERHAFLLESMQQFGPADIAYILELELEAVHALLHRARTMLERARLPGVLIVEDDWLVALDMESAVVEMGFRVCGTARSEQEAISIARQTRPDLILADVNLSTGGDGIKACEQICRSRPTSVIYVTGYPDKIEQNRGQLVVPKPFQVRSLSRAVRQALNAR